MTRTVKPYEDGILIYDPWYNRVMQVLDAVEQYIDRPISLMVDGVSLSLNEVFGEIAIELYDIRITAPIFTLTWLLTLKLTDRIYRGGVVQGTATAETISWSSFKGHQ